ncbi:Uncharacterized protein BP5553_07381 [Venustampulla echinocandica]|uniref:Uncharacterized protein n=1 Tax=Venustampulla echinocandica TaxID=2656787 RepID=A0A370TJC9_9HELO|nr:Uncharacterized protein BP5553_07381 [Venustampulla echinocandica]RDL35450.1 Uncharacterized protein BP5553_07381 [Venustampulla echinocandica]
MNPLLKKSLRINSISDQAKPAEATIAIAISITIETHARLAASSATQMLCSGSERYYSIPFHDRGEDKPAKYMDPTFKFPGSPGAPLFQISADRVNQQRPLSQYDFDTSSASMLGENNKSHSRDSSVHEKVAAFNSLAFQGKQLERKANDAALKRAMLGREEAESEMRRYRDETRSLRRHVEEGRERERKVGERLETVMVGSAVDRLFLIISDKLSTQENYGRAKETYAHTQALWEKEIRRARKESFKSQSVIVKLQEELKASRNSMRIAQSDLEQEKERSLKREQEAFAARYQLVGVQEELAQMQENIKLVEQERDALRTIAKNEEIARIAAEGRMPLPALPEHDEFASPKKPRKSLDPVTVTSSAAAEEELDDMRLRLEWEHQRADRAYDRIEFLEMECRWKCCASRNTQEGDCAPPTQATIHVLEHSQVAKSSTVFIPAEGVFRTVSPTPEESPWMSLAKNNIPVFAQPAPEPAPEPLHAVNYARTPSCEPPTSAILPDANTSLLSLLDAPHSPSHSAGNNYEEDGSNTTVIQTFHTISTTTRIPLADPPELTPPTTLPTDLSNPALSPTMSREKALAQIRERRGRAKSLAQGTMTPRKQMAEGMSRRDISAPAVRNVKERGRSQARA